MIPTTATTPTPPPPSSTITSNSSSNNNAVPYGHLPSFLPGSSSLVEQLDRRVLIVLRDGRHLVGVLRSFDQFSNMVLEDTSERRIYHQNKDKKDPVCYYTDVKLGLYLVRGDSMVLLGEVEESDDDDDNSNRGFMKRLSLEEYNRMVEEDKKEAEEGEKDATTLIWDFDTDLVA
uniref:U6 snRNA-associated Sm-like protein LSm1 n=1 Tax=Helicotheca tamesis TaxID=374047 RepID=A0A7S2MNL0_9STRA